MKRKHLGTVTFPWGETFEGVTAHLARYGNGDPALVLANDIEGQIATPTVNLESYGIHPAPGHVNIKSYSEGEGMLALLVKHSVVEDTGEFFEFGPFGTRAAHARLTGWTEADG